MNLEIVFELTLDLNSTSSKFLGQLFWESDLGPWFSILEKLWSSFLENNKNFLIINIKQKTEFKFEFPMLDYLWSSFLENI
jgi:hypothetical protein